MKTYSQYGQDKYIYKTFFETVIDGVFVDVGAEDGERFSNTKMFEDVGWTGLCIEPRPQAYENVIKVRNCLAENCAISDEEGEFEFLSINEYGKGLSGLVDKYPPEHIQRIRREVQYTKDNLIKVRCRQLKDVLSEHKIKKINYLSIDVEGAELNVLKSIDWDTCDIEVISTENNYGETTVDNYLKSVGYIKKAKVSIDDIYYRV